MLQMYGSLRSLLHGLYDNADAKYATTEHAKHAEPSRYDVTNDDDVSRLLGDVYDLCYIHVKR